MRCLQCRAEITTGNRKWQLFHRNSGCMGTFHSQHNDCFYCGEQKECKDHPWPIMSRPEETNEGVTRQRRDGETLPACRECNYILWKHGFETITERLLFVAKAYKKRANKTGKAIYSKKMVFALEQIKNVRKNYF